MNASAIYVIVTPSPNSGYPTFPPCTSVDRGAQWNPRRRQKWDTKLPEVQ